LGEFINLLAEHIKLIEMLESMWVSLRRGRDCALAKKAPRVMISIKFLFLLDSQVNFTRACQFGSQLINQKKIIMMIL
jgi:hypothetical protein